MIGDEYSVVFNRTVDLVDNSKSGEARYDAKLPPGTYTATLIENPTSEGGSNWLLFDDSGFGATADYIRSVASSITALS